MKRNRKTSAIRDAVFHGIEALESRMMMSAGHATPAVASGGTIGGAVFSDATGRGLGGAPIAGAQVYLDLNGIDTPVASDPIATTDVNGNYRFNNLAAGNYLVRMVPKAGQVTTLPVWGGKFFVQLAQNQTISGDNFLAETITTPSLTLANGQLLVSGTSASGSATLARFNPDGSVDTTYGTLGTIVITGVAGQATSIVGLSNGNISVTYSSQTATLSGTGTIISIGGTTSLNAPTALSATANSATLVTLTFIDNSTNEQSFAIERAAGASGPWTNVGTLAGTSGTGTRTMTDATVVAGTTYFYRVYAISGATQSGIAGPIGITTPTAPPPPPPPPPSGATISGALYNDANANRTRDPGENALAGQQLYLDLQGVDAFVAGDPLATTDANGSYTFTNLAAGNYLVRVLPQSGRVVTSPIWGGKYFFQLAKNQVVSGNDFLSAPVSTPHVQMSNGQLLVTGTAGGLATIARYSPDGSVDTTYGTLGIMTISAVQGQASAMTALSDGTISITYPTQIVILTSSGAVSSITSTGPVTPPPPPNNFPPAGSAWVPFAQILGQDVAANQYPKITGAGVGVAIIDRGIDYNAPQIGAGKIVYQYNFRDGNTIGLDDYGHGTGVAGIIAANGYTYAGQYNQGVAPGVNLIDLKQESSAGIKAALDWVIANHALYNIQVVNITDFISQVLPGSWNPTLYLPELKTIHDMGIFISSPVGNGEATYGPNLPIDNPALSPYVTGVGGIDLTGQFYVDSKRGPGLQILAPAIGVTMPYYSRNVNSVGYDQYDDNYDGTAIVTNYATGTSWASAYVAGAAALLKQISPKLTGDQIQQIMKDSGTPVLDPTNNVYYARLNIQAAIALAYQRLGIKP